MQMHQQPVYWSIESLKWSEKMLETCSEGFMLKLATVPIIGIGTILLGYTGTITGEAVVGILGAMVGFLVGEQNGIRKATK